MDEAARESVSSLVQCAKNEITSGNGSSNLEFRFLTKICTLLPPNSESITVEGDVFIKDYYYEFLVFLLSQFEVSYHEVDEEVKKLGNLIKKLLFNGPPEQAFVAACQSLNRLGTETFLSLKMVEWISGLVENDCIGNALCKRCKECQMMVSSVSNSFADFIQSVSSLPSIILSRSSRDFASDLFYHDNYSLVIGKQIMKALTFSHGRLFHNQDTSVVPISRLLGKMCITGFRDGIWKHLINEISIHLEKSMLWRRVVQQVLSNVDDWCFECTIEPLILQMKSPKQIEEFLGDIPLKKKKLEVILTRKFILNRYFPEPNIATNILIYLASNAYLLHMFNTIFIEVLDIWCDKNSLRHQPFEQTRYLCQIILVGVRILRDTKDVGENVKERINKAVLEGLPIYLNSTIVEVRQMGMIVAQNLALFVGHGETKLELPIEKNEFTNKLISLLERNVHDEMRTTVDEEQANTTEESSKTDNIAPLDSDDDDLEPLNSNPRKRGAPTFLSQCMEGLLNYEDPEFMGECLKSCEGLILSHPELGELHVELCKILIRLENRFSFNNFHALKYSALVSLVVKSPEAIAEFLTKQFYEQNYNICHRLEMLDVLVDGAKRISFACSTERNKESDCGDTEESNNSSLLSDWQQVVKKRIDLKTRRFAKDRSKIRPKEVMNRFSTCAGWFFYPLLKNFDTKGNLDLDGEDTLLLEKLLHSLACIVYCSINIPMSGSMAKTLMQFCGCFRMHREVAVRRAVLNSICVCITILEAGHLLHIVPHELSELHSWLSVAVAKESDSECAQLAEQILCLLGQLWTESLK